MEYFAIGAESPYENVVGESWKLLAPGVRVALSPPLKAVGTLSITRAHGGLAGLLAQLMLLPPEGDAVPTMLELRAEEGGVRWARQFGSMRAESLQTFSGRTYSEEAGPFRLRFRAEQSGSSLAHVQIGTAIHGLPVPSFCGPTVRALMSEGPNDTSWTLMVDIGHPWFGSICRYEGVMSSE